MSDKPTYTKEMHERGELPPVGSEVALRYKFDSKTVAHRGRILFASGRNIILEKNGRDVHFNACDYIVEPIPTIEDELIDFITNRAWNSKELAVALLEKFNITPKAQK